MKACTILFWWALVALQPHAVDGKCRVRNRCSSYGSIIGNSLVASDNQAIIGGRLIGGSHTQAVSITYINGRKYVRENEEQYVCCGRQALGCAHVYECPVDYEPGSWGSWSECSQTCGSGIQTRSWRILRSALNGGEDCQGGTQEMRSCTLQRSCPAPPGPHRPMRPSSPESGLRAFWKAHALKLCGGAVLTFSGILGCVLCLQDIIEHRKPAKALPTARHTGSAGGHSMPAMPHSHTTCHTAGPTVVAVHQPQPEPLPRQSTAQCGDRSPPEVSAQQP